MNRFLCCVVLFCISCVAFSQKLYFVYLQTETNQPFFLTSNEKLHRSSGSGYMVFTNLVDSTYIFKIGFPQGQWPEQQFSLTIASKDRGFLVKNFAEKGWGLFDLQTMAVLMADVVPKDSITANAEVSAFTSILAKAANDPSLRQKPGAAEQQRKAEEDLAAKNLDEKRKADSTAFALQEIQKEANRREDSIRLALQRKKEADDLAAKNLEEKRKADSMAIAAQEIKKETNRREDSTRLAALQRKKEADDLAAKNLEEKRRKADSTAIAAKEIKKETNRREDSSRLAVLQRKKEADDLAAKNLEEKRRKADSTAIAAKEIKKETNRREDSSRLAVLQRKKEADDLAAKNLEEKRRKADSTAIAAKEIKKETNRTEDSSRLAVLQRKKEADDLAAKNLEEKRRKADSTAIAAKEIKKETNRTEDSSRLAAQQKKAADDRATTKLEETKRKADSTALASQSIKREIVPVGLTGESDKAPAVKNNGVAGYKRSVITKKSESSTTEGFGLVFIDELAAGNKDTVKIVIPNPVNFVSRAKDPVTEDKKFLNVTSDEKDLSPAVKAAPPKKACISVASDNDFLKLRKKMAAQKTEDGMISESRKVFKSKCFTTEQVKNLGSLFLNEAGKFQFYETAYPFNSDRNNFGSLQVEFKDAYFIHRFKKMVN